ncbi:hypothetical protein [Sphaerospermopsis sp. LEGE 08334]|uniref:hypothetical protein n=1 Tax=Sphaerospermopsis sp. LEGE 08334 TaxID=1828651 RepID=UPI0018815857|nr:hypothetical protein [Sphaerospermopsis sp. LEGE 08334]MBE9059310.1 hypothetical protein [Sphaerospermopsis sp. LEGE 08334]
MVKRDEGAYLLTAANGNKYVLGLDNATYNSIGSSIGLTKLGENTPIPDDADAGNSINDLIALGAARKISCRVEMTDGKLKRKIIVCPANKPFKALIGKQVKIMNSTRTGYDTGTIKGAVVKTYRRFK